MPLQPIPRQPKAALLSALIAYVEHVRAYEPDDDAFVRDVRDVVYGALRLIPNHDDQDFILSRVNATLASLEAGADLRLTTNEALAHPSA